MKHTLKIQRLALGLLFIAALVLGSGEVAMSKTSSTLGVKNILLVHGGFVDGSGWCGGNLIMSDFFGENG